MQRHLDYRSSFFRKLLRYLVACGGSEDRSQLTGWQVSCPEGDAVCTGSFTLPNGELVQSFAGDFRSPLAEHFTSFCAVACHLGLYPGRRPPGFAMEVTTEEH